MSKSIKVSYDNYIPDEEDVQKSDSTKSSLTIAVLFLLSGCPNSFNIGDSLWCELPWFEASQPEGYTLPSWFLLMQSIGTVVVLCLLWVETHVTIFSKSILLYCMSFGTVLLSGVLSFTWHFSVNGWSIFLYLAVFAGLLTGWIQMIFIIPWIVANYNPRIISVFLAGNTLMIFVLMSLDLIQQPGGAQIFSPEVYYMVTVIIYAITFGICVYTFRSGIGRITSKDEVKALEPWRSSLWTQTLTPVFWDTKVLTFGRIWLIQISWAVIPVALPYASFNTTTSEANDGKNFLQWAIAIGYLTEFLGSVTSYSSTGKFWIRQSIAVNTVSNGVIILAASNIGVWSSWWMKFLLMSMVAVSRFSYGWTLPLIPRELSRRYPDMKELLVRSNSLWSLYANLVVRIPLWMVSSGIIPSSVI